MPELLTAREGELLILTLNRPEKKNALTPAMLEQLDAELARVADDASVRAVIVTGAGEKAFSAGMDVGAIFEVLSSNLSPEQARNLVKRLQSIFARLEDLDRPTIAAIEGACLGAGFELALACDLRVASTEAKFGLPETKVGLIPDLGGSTRLPRIVGPAVAKEWIFTARTYPAVRALEHGLINELAVPGDALVRAKDLAKEIAANAPRAIAWAKRVIDRGVGLSIQQSLELEQDAMSEILPSQELRERVLRMLQAKSERS